MNSCVVYFYKSNKNYFKEDYESAYICSYLKKFGNSDVFLYSPATPLALNTKYDLYFIKIYEKEQLSDLYLFIKQNSISVSTIFFYGQYCRNNYELFLGYFSSCGGVIVEDEYDTITSIMESSNACKGIAYVADGVIRKNLGASHISIEKIPNGDRRISKNINQSFAEVVFSRGCRRHCSFCTIASSKAYDCKSNRLILEELQEIVATTNIKEIIFKDLSFDDRIYVYGKKSIGELAEKIIENNLNIKYDVNFRIGTFSSQNTEDVLLFRLLRKSGLVRRLLGVESFVESDLRLYNKTYQVSDIIDTIQLCRQNLIYPICSFIFLNPYTKLSDFEYNLGECNRLHLLDFLPASLNVLRPEKESLLYKRLLKDKMLIEGANDIKIIWSDKRIKILADLFQNFYNHKKIWRIYIWVSILHELIYELKFLNVRPDSASLLKRVDDILLEINDKNYEFLLDIISEITLDKEKEELFSMFDIFLDNIENSYISKFKILYREIRKEIEISKKILKYNHSIL